ncbi:MAG: PTS sugar transporter subunit IIA [Pseudomonadota bacterium]
MIGMVLVTHGSLATSFKHAVEHVVGTQKQFATVCIEADDDMEQRRRDIIDAVANVDSGRGVIVVTDMFGGTPSNLAISLMKPGEVEIIAGANLPMLIKLARVRQEQNMEQTLSEGAEAGKKYINVASQLLTARA